jgi:hypothetical protein
MAVSLAATQEQTAEAQQGDRRRLRNHGDRALIQERLPIVIVEVQQRRSFADSDDVDENVIPGCDRGTGGKLTVVKLFLSSRPFLQASKGICAAETEEQSLVRTRSKPDAGEAS